MEGEVVTAQIVGPSGGVSTHRHCPQCLVPLYNTNLARPGLAIVRAGTLDGSETLTPMLHVFASTKQPWLQLPGGAEVYEALPPMEVWARMIDGWADHARILNS